MNHEHRLDCNDNGCENHYASIAGQVSEPPDTEIEYEEQVAQVAADAVEKSLGVIRGRSFTVRHPELGKMIKCQVCTRRHRDSIKCEQKFKELFIEEDTETGEKTTIYATAVQPQGVEIRGQISAQQPTIKQVIGAAQFKGKRLKSHPNRYKLQFIERIRKVFEPGEFDPNSDVHKAALEIARKIAARELKNEARADRRHFRLLRRTARRINQGLLNPGARA
jgi:hypothetical protein